MSILTLQKRVKECGRIRIGHKGSKGEPKALSVFRFTSYDKHAIEVAAQIYGGEVRPCTEKDLMGQFEVITTAAEIPFMVALTEPSQYMELWSGGGCTRRCDGQTELLTGNPCMCDPDEPECKATTRLPIILPDLPGLGTWRLETHSINAAIELIPTFELLQAMAGRGQFPEATLAIEQRQSKKNGLTRRFVVPVIRSKATPRQLLGDRPLQGLGESGAALPPKTNGDHVQSLPPAQPPAHTNEKGELKQPNPRGAVFAIIAEMGLPEHVDDAKELYYQVFGAVLKRPLTTLSDVTDAEWETLMTWLKSVDAERITMPKAFKSAGGKTKPERDDPFGDVPKEPLQGDEDK